MFDVKVKTLDGRTQEYSVPDNATVLQFKEIVLETTDIPIERQRLLYQGRVLVDDRILNSYDVAGNVMHLVTRLPPQPRPTEEVTTDPEDSHDNHRDHIGNMLSEVLGSLGDFNSAMGVSVNNEGNRMDITVNIPSQNRLSLSRLRQNYVMRLLHQARTVINHMEDPSSTEPQSDRERLRQIDPYDIGPNDEMLTEVTSQPLPISNLADMIGMTRALWRSAEPQLELWESVLRRENGQNGAQRTDIEMQHLHDSASRYVHLFSHVLHILSDYLVEFQPSAITRATATRVNAQTSTTDSATTTDTTTNAPTDESEIDDRSRYLYVFSEMPAQLVQVRLDVDSTIHDLRSGTAAPTAPTSAMPPPQSTESTRPNVPAPSPVSTSPNTQLPTSAAPRTPDIPDLRSRTRRRIPTSTNTTSNLLRSTLHEAILGSATSRSQTATGSRALRTGSHFPENIDPYLRCQSRHFQHPSSLRTGAVISTFSGIRVRDNSRPRPRAPNTSTTTPVTSAANSTTTNVQSQSIDNDPMQSILSGLMNSIFSPGPIEATRPLMATSTTRSRYAPASGANRIQNLLSSVGDVQGRDLNVPLSTIYPALTRNSQNNTERNFIINRIFNTIANRLSFMDFMGIIRGRYTSLNRLREPLQEILISHQREVGSRDQLIDHMLADMEAINHHYVTVFDQLRRGEHVAELSEEARGSFNVSMDVLRTLTNLNRHHLQSMIDMILRSPTNQGFGQLLMNSIKSHHADSLALIDIMCNSNTELRHFLIHSMMNSIHASVTASTNDSGVRDIAGLECLFGSLDNNLFNQPELLTDLRENSLSNFVVYLSEDNEVSPMADQNDSMDLIEDMITNLSENVTNGAHVGETDRQLPPCLVNGDHHEGSRGPGWQTVMPDEWIQVVSRDAAAAAAEEGPNGAVPYSDAYVSGMPAKRRKVIVSGRSVRPAADMMHDCLDQAIVSAGFVAGGGQTAPPTALTDAFRDLVTERVSRRLDTANEDGAANFVPDRFPSADNNFNVRRKRTEDGNSNCKKNN